MTRLLFSLFVISFLCLFAAGCNSGTGVKGKVTFDDGTPLTVGTVLFETETEQMIGAIQKDGTYWMSPDGKKVGIPNGTYRVAISGAVEPTGEFDPDRGGRQIMRPLIDEKFITPSTSGLTCEVNGARTFDITVTRPGTAAQ